ncbi:MAG: 50S ribosomal protein L5 [Deltaproteobacteria bacterium]|nr:50S ribosomal protein L5 [Deltaproteobacteria bacterium]
MPRLLRVYKEKIIPLMMREFSYKNVMQTPRLVKIVVNVGMGGSVQDIKLLDSALDELAAITGQRGVITRARKSVAAFKLRKGMPIGCKVTLRRERMYDFLDRFINFALPRVRDFRGVSPKGFDGRGNYSLGLTEQLVFPEIDYDKVQKVHGMSISIVTTAKTDEECRFLLESFGMPFKKE